MKWLDRLARNQSNYAQARYERAKGGSDAAMTALDYPQRKLKEAISGDEESWGLPDFSYDVNVGNRAGYRGTAAVTDEAVETGLDLFADPVNAVGAGLFKRGLKAANMVGDIAGNTLSAARNYIPNHYAPSKAARPTRVDELIMQNQQALSRIPKVGPRISRLENTQASANMREKVGSFVDWMGDTIVRGAEQTISPTARANFRENQVTQTMQDVAREARQSGLPRDQAKAVAQAQYTTNVRQQAGGSGGVAEAVDDINRRSFLTEPVPVTSGAYKELIKGNKLQGRYESGRAFSVSDKDLDIIGDHVTKVWTDSRGRPLTETPGSKIRIKNAGAGDQVTGQHHFDFQSKSGVNASFKLLFKDGKLTTEELFEQAKKRSDANKKYNDNRNKDKDKAKWVLSERSNTLEKAKNNGLWVTGSFTVNAVTEGGVNYIAKVSPDGRIMAVISDEHNFLEKTPVLGPVLESALPNRALSVTPPMHYDLRGGRKTVKPEQPKDKKNVKQSLFDLETAQPSKEALRAERQINAGVGTIATGMLTGGNREERR